MPLGQKDSWPWKFKGFFNPGIFLHCIFEKEIKIAFKKHFGIFITVAPNKRETSSWHSEVGRNMFLYENACPETMPM